LWTLNIFFIDKLECPTEEEKLNETDIPGPEIVVGRHEACRDNRSKEEMMRQAGAARELDSRRSRPGSILDRTGTDWKEGK